MVWPADAILTDPSVVPISLSGHKNSVWAVTSFPRRENAYLTGSADRTIKLWENGHETKTFVGHEDVVRALVTLSDTCFISAANDSTLRIWDTDTGTCLHTLHSLTNEYIYRYD